MASTSHTHYARYRLRFGKEADIDVANDRESVAPWLRQNQKAATHVTGVIDKVAVAIGMLGDLDNLAPVLLTLGAKHATFGVTEAHFPVVGGAFLRTLEQGLGDVFTPDVKAAYTAMWGVVTSTMLAGAAQFMAQQEAGAASN
uniref:Globin domain-containing protein n=1 Tax=Phaeomonas parva TaxID=124430 RepID=A0A7S1XPT0_9STRA|mmetsp:Transcript_27729/g.88009  ORF Transcript_27729/g.88009 Transcript_27729/m.88009 type:complete len:143 (+) Transcript_27729:400-828(+)